MWLASRWYFLHVSKSVCGQVYTLDNAMICKRGGFVMQRHNELRVLDIEHGTLTSLIFTTTRRMSDFDKNKIWLYSKVVSQLLLWISLLSLPLLSKLWLYYLFDTDFQFFSFLSKWAFARYSYRSGYSPASCHLNAINIRFVGFHKARKDKMQCQGKNKN